MILKTIETLDHFMDGIARRIEQTSGDRLSKLWNALSFAAPVWNRRDGLFRSGGI